MAKALSIADWLGSAGLDDLRGIFEAEDITPELVDELDDDDLRELGLTLGQRKRFRAAQQSGGVDEQIAKPVAEDAPVSEQRGERRQLTVVFVDLVGSTDLSRRLDPEDMSDLLHRYQDVVSGTVVRMGGHIHQFLGDGVLAFFGWPLAREDAVEQAVRASLAIVGQVSTLGAPQNETLGCRIGIATGLVVALPDGQVSGETPNLAARLQAIGQPGSVVVSGTTVELTKGMFAFEPIEKPILKGFSEDTEAFLVTDARLGVTRFEARGQLELSPIIGREDELGILAAEWERARNGQGRAVRIDGEAGIGKSRLLAGLKAMFPGSDHFRSSYQCSPNSSDVPLWPVSESLKRTYEFSGPAGPEEHRARLQGRMERIGNDTPDALNSMARLIDVDIGPDPEYDVLDARIRRSRTLETLVRQAECISAVRPVQIVLEDAHWADRTTLEYIGRLMGRIAQLPILVIVTSRGGDGMEDAEWSAHIHLERLGKTESRAMIEGMLNESAPDRTGPVSATLLDTLTSRGEGVPLFLIELTRGLLLAQSGSSDSRHADVPVTLHDLLMARLDRLGPAKAIAQSASCIGREFSLELLGQALGRTEASLSAPLADLTEAGILVPASTHAKEDYVFYHALIRDAAYESLLFKDRQVLHSKVLSALDNKYDVRPETLAQHAEAAGDMRRAGEEFLRAGKRAAARWANGEAELLLTRALNVITKWESGQDRLMAEIECRLALGDALGAIHGYASSMVQENYAAACDLCENAGVPDLLFNALRGLWNGLYNSGSFVKSLPYAERMRDLAEETGELRHWVTAQRSLGSNYLSVNRFQESSATFRDCIRRGAELPGGAATSYGELPVAFAHGMMSQLESFSARLDTALDLVKRCGEIARANGHPLAVNQALAIAGIVHWFRNEPEEALKVAQEEAQLATDYGYVHWKAHSDVMIGACRARLGEVDDGLAQLADGIDAWIGTGARSYAPVFYCYLADCALKAGHVERARVAVEDGMKLAQSSGEFFGLAELQRLRAQVVAPEQLESCLKEALATAEDQGANLYLLRALCDALTFTQHVSPELQVHARQRLATLLETLDEHVDGHDMTRAYTLMKEKVH